METQENPDPSPEPSLQEPGPGRPLALVDTLRRALRPMLGSQRWFARDGPRPVFRLSLERVTLLLGGLVFASGVATTTAAAFGWFRVLAPLLWGVWIVVLLVAVGAVALRRYSYEGDWGDVVAALLGLVLAFSAGMLHHHYYAAQADIGFYISDATATAQTGSRYLTGPYDFLLPGFSPSEQGARAEAMFGYSSLAAMFAYAFGMFATPWVNAPLAFLGALAIYRVARRLSGPVGALLALVLWSTSLLTVWMTRWTMTENAAIPAFWISTLLALSLWSAWDHWRAGLLAVSLAFGALARPDGLMFLAWFPFLLLLRYRTVVFSQAKAIFLEPRKRVVGTAAIGLVAFLVAGAGVVVYSLLPHQYLDHATTLASGLLQGRVAADAMDVPTTGLSPNWGDYALRFEWDSAMAYALPWMLLVGLAGIALGLIPRKGALLVALWAVPYLAFVFMPPVTTAHPWFMRRLWMGLVPLTYILAGASLDIARAGWRWPQAMDRRGNLGPRRLPALRTTAIAAGLIFLVFVVGHAQATMPVVLKREQDSVRPSSETILDFLPTGAAVIIDEDVVEFASVVRFHHDGPVVPWFNQRVSSFFATFDADAETNATVILRLPAQNRNFIEIDPRGATLAKLSNGTVENTVRRDLRAYIAAPPLAQGYAPFAQYLENDVPPNQWVTANQPFQLLLASKPLALTKNIRFNPDQWGRGPQGIYALSSPSELMINLSKFRAHALETYALGVHFVYVQHDTIDRPVYVPGQPEPIGVLKSDGSGGLGRASFALPRPLNVTSVYVPHGAILRGALLDLI
jgi:hypothetical protein